MNKIVKVVVVLAAAMMAIGGTAPLAGGQESPVVVLGQDRIAPNEQLQVQGAGWPSGALVTLELCGNNALDASADCDNRGSVSFAVRQNGQFFGVLPVRIPPRACPCVVRVTTPGGEERLTPIEFPSAGFLTAEERIGDPTLQRAVVIEELHIDGNGGWTQWFGAPTTREIVLVMQNRGDVGMRDVATVVTFGAGSDPTDIVETTIVDQLLPGERVEFRLPVDVPALTAGARTAKASVTGIGEDAVATTQVSVHPWGLYALAVLVLQLVLLWIRNQVRTWIGRRVEDEEVDEVLEIGPGESVVDLTDERELVLAGASTGGASSVFADPVAPVSPPVVPAVSFPAPPAGPLDELHGPPEPAEEPMEWDALVVADTDTDTDPGPDPDSHTVEDAVEIIAVISDEPADSALDFQEDPLAQFVVAPVGIPVVLEDEPDAEPETEPAPEIIDLRDDESSDDELVDEPSSSEDATSRPGVDAERILRSATELTAAIRRDTDAAIDASRVAAEVAVEGAAASVEGEADEVRRVIAAEQDRAVAEARAATERMAALRAEADETAEALRLQAERDRERAVYVLGRAEREADDVVTAAKERIALMEQDLIEVHDGIVAAGGDLRDRIAAIEAELADAAVPDLADVDDRIADVLGRFETTVDETRARLDREQQELRARARVASVEAVTRVAAQAASMANDAIDAAGGTAAPSPDGGEADVSDALAAAIQSAVKRSLDPQDVPH